MPTDARAYLARTVSRRRRQASLTRNELALLADMSRQLVSLTDQGPLGPQPPAVARFALPQPRQHRP